MMSNLVLEIWELFRDNVPIKKREDVAVSFLKILENNDIYPPDQQFIKGEDETLDKIIDILYAEEVEYDQEDKDDTEEFE